VSAHLAPLLAVTFAALSAILAGVVLWILQREKRSSERHRQLEEVVHELAAEGVDARGIVEVIHRNLQPSFAVREFRITIFDDEDRVEASWHLPPAGGLPVKEEKYEYVGKPIDRAHLESLVVPDSFFSKSVTPMDFLELRRRRFRLPLYCGQVLVGLWDLKFDEELSRWETDRLKSLYRFVSDALFSERNSRWAARDTLSGLFLRRYFDARLAAEIERSLRHGHELSVAAFDLDDFKRLNDTHGHAAGDETIRAFASLLSSALRGEDVCARRGGEEFAAFFPETAAAAAGTVCDRLRRDLESFGPEHDGSRLAVTVSVGVATLRKGDDVARLLARADEGLYRAKRDGRNRVIVTA
jgi:diguanylate cyclase (GGDEF)-like protein